MKEIPILFSTPMGQAILKRRKTKTRRLKGLGAINENPNEWSLQDTFTHVGKYERDKYIFRFTDGKGGFIDIPCPYGRPGDILWVRESVCPWNNPYGPEYAYKADGFIKRYGAWERDTPNEFHDVERIERFKPSVHMPKAAARIWLKVTDIRVERLHDISKEDALAEGILHDEIGFKDYDKARAKGYGHPDHDYPHVQDARLSFLSLWESINGFESRNSNPWVWVISFEVLSTTGRPENIEPRVETPGG